MIEHATCLQAAGHDRHAQPGHPDASHLCGGGRGRGADRMRTSPHQAAWPTRQQSSAWLRRNIRSGKEGSGYSVTIISNEETPLVC